MRCTHYTYPPGRPHDHVAAMHNRCQREATHHLLTPDGKRCPGSVCCLEHGQAVVDEYATKLHEQWSLQAIDQYGDPQLPTPDGTPTADVATTQTQAPAKTITFYGREYEVTPERRKRIASALTETQGKLEKELRHPEDLQHKQMIDFYNSHIAELQAMLS